MSLFLLAYDASHPSLNPDTLHRFVTNSLNFSGWAHYYPGCYMLVSDLPVRELSGQIEEVLRSGKANGPSFVLTRMENETTDGWLPKPAWDWFFKHQAGSWVDAAIDKTMAES